MGNLVSKYYRYRSAWWRMQRVLFPSPAEVRFIELMGGRVVTFHKIRGGQNKYPLVIVVSLGRILKRQNYKREVRYGSKFVDFANDLDRIIEIDGGAYHNDPVHEMEREIYIHSRYPATRFLRIPAYKVFNNTADVQRKVMAFID